MDFRLTLNSKPYDLAGARFSGASETDPSTLGRMRQLEVAGLGFRI